MAFTHTPEECRAALVGLRERLRLSQLDVAKACNVNRTTLCLWEHGHTTLPDETLGAITNYLADELASLKAVEVSAHPARVVTPLAWLRCPGREN